jgi:aflatoxin B1 aldehyde reductase
MKLILGSMSFNLANVSHRLDIAEINKIIDSYASYVNHVPQLDCARYYNNEQLLNQCQLDNLLIDTKANPWLNNIFSMDKLGQLSPKALNQQLDYSLDNLSLNSCHIFYLHAPDHQTPILETLEACDTLYRQEKYNYLGISNYSANQLIEIMELCEKNGYQSPKYYQGMLNPLCQKVNTVRNLLCDWNMSFNAYNILAGGLLTGKYNLSDPNLIKGRFSNNQIYQNIFWRPPILKAVSQITDNLEPSQTLLDLTYSWLKYHAKLKDNDSLILGVSSLSQLKDNFRYLDRCKPLSYLQLGLIQDIWKDIKRVSPEYYY